MLNEPSAVLPSYYPGDIRKNYISGKLPDLTAEWKSGVKYSSHGLPSASHNENRRREETLKHTS